MLFNLPLWWFLVSHKPFKPFKHMQYRAIVFVYKNRVNIAQYDI